MEIIQRFPSLSKQNNVPKVFNKAARAWKTASPQEEALS
jgi:hypothetical protein